MPIETNHDDKKYVTFKDLKHAIDTLDTGINERLDRIDKKLDLLLGNPVKPNGYIPHF